MNPIIRVRCEKGAELPSYQSEGAAGADVSAYLPDGDIVLAPGEFRLVSIGLSFEIPSGFEIQVRPRSGLAAKKGISIVNAPGTVDSDYRGIVMVNLINLGKEDFIVHDKDRIAQIVVAPVAKASFTESETLGDTARGKGGFGSTGI